MIKSKYTTLVFESDTAEKLAEIRKYSASEICRAWSMDHEILRLELIQKALEENNTELAISYYGEVDVAKFKDRLNSHPQPKEGE